MLFLNILEIIIIIWFNLYLIQTMMISLIQRMIQNCVEIFQETIVPKNVNNTL